MGQLPLNISATSTPITKPNMKLLATLCSAAVASAGILPGPLGPIHVPQLVAHPNGAVTPADEPAVVAARADHLQAKGAAFQAAVASGPGFVGPAIAAAPIAAPALPYAAPTIAAPIIAPAPIIAGPRPYVGPLAGVPQLVAHPNGAVTPADTPSVVAARADHLAAKGAAFHAAIASGPVLVGPVAGPAFAPAPLAPAVRAIGPIAPAVRAIGPIAPAVPAIAPALPYAGPLAGVPALVAHPNGAVVPADEPA